MAPPNGNFGAGPAGFITPLDPNGAAKWNAVLQKRMQSYAVQNPEHAPHLQNYFSRYSNDPQGAAEYYAALEEGARRGTLSAEQQRERAALQGFGRATEGDSAFVTVKNNLTTWGGGIGGLGAAAAAFFVLDGKGVDTWWAVGGAALAGIGGAWLGSQIEKAARDYFKDDKKADQLARQQQQGRGRAPGQNRGTGADLPEIEYEEDVPPNRRASLDGVRGQNSSPATGNPDALAKAREAADALKADGSQPLGNAALTHASPADRVRPGLPLEAKLADDGKNSLRINT